MLFGEDMEELVHKDSLRSKYQTSLKKFHKIEQICYTFLVIGILVLILLIYLDNVPPALYVGYVLFLGLCLGPLMFEKKIHIGLNKFICPHCLKTVLLNEVSFTCPFCNKKYNYDGEGSFQNYLFDQCACGGKIKYIKCCHCLEPINLFAPYDENKIEAKRYE